MPLLDSIEKVLEENDAYTEFDLGKAAIASAWITHCLPKSSNRLDPVFALMHKNLLLGRCFRSAQEGLGDFSIKLAALAHARECGFIKD